MLGGDYWLAKGAQKTIGDDIRLNNGDRDNHLSVYAQTDYTSDIVSAFAGALLTATVYQHWDKYNYTDNPYSEKVLAWGGNLKAGISAHLADNHLIYLNGGLYSRAPYSNIYFASGTNEITKDVRNERNYIVETGYKWNAAQTQLTVNAYYNYWQNKSLMSDPYKQEDFRPFLITGLDAQHAGVEADYHQTVTNRFAFSVFASLGYWQWKNDVNAIIYDSSTNLSVENIQVYTDGLMVGDAPQTQIGATVDFKIFDRLLIRAEGRYNDRMYADFKPEKRANPNDRSQSYRIPSSFVADLHIQFPFRLDNIATDLFFTCNNLLNSHYIERGEDGDGHDLASFRGFWNVGRTVQVGLRAKF